MSWARAVVRVVNYGDGRPIGNAEAIFKDLVAELKAHTDRLQQVLAADLPAFNAEAKRLNLPPIGVSGYSSAFATATDAGLSTSSPIR